MLKVLSSTVNNSLIHSFSIGWWFLIGLILIQIVLVPVIASAIIFVLSKKFSYKTGWFAFIALFYTTILTLIVASQTTGGTSLVETYNWAPNIGLFFGLQADGLSIPFVLTINVLSLLISVYSIHYMKHRIAEKPAEFGAYYAFHLLYVSGMVGTVLATNLIELFLFYEFMLIPSYFLIAQWGYGERQRISLMYFLWTHIGALALLMGILLTYATAGSLNISEISTLLAQTQPSFMLLMGITILMLVGFFVKMAVFGLHIWLPHAHAEAPTPISALLSPAMIGIGGYLMIRTTITFFPSAFQAISGMLSIWALITIIYGGIMALTQDDIKRLLAYSSISQMGYLLLGISSGNVLGVSGSAFHYVSHGVSKGLLFMVAGAIILQADGLRSITRLGGLWSKMPVTTIAAFVGFLGIMGMPPLTGFQSEWMLFSGVFSGAIASNSPIKLITASTGIIATFLTACYGLWTIRRIFFGQLPEYLEEVKEAPLTIIVPLLILSATSLLLGVYPAIITEHLLPIISSIIGT